MEAEQESEAAAAAAELHNAAASSTENPTADEKEEVVSGVQKETVLKDEEPVSTGNSTSEEMRAPTHPTCLTVQPKRVLCGVRLHNKDNITVGQSCVQVLFNMNSHFSSFKCVAEVIK